MAHLASGLRAGDTGVSGPTGLALAALDTLTVAVLVAAPDGAVQYANPAARKLGLRGPGAPLPSAIGALAASARVEPGTVVQQFTLAPPVAPTQGSIVTRDGPTVRVRARALDTDGHVALVFEDLTESLRVDAVRRDFVANVSHELKTPVGAIQLLAEALHDASDDPTAVRHFATRLTKEAARLGGLVQELIDLSRLQSGELRGDANPTAMEQVVREAVDRNRHAADTKNIRVQVVIDAQQPAGSERYRVFGVEANLTTAVSNLVENAIAYSPERTLVVVGLHRRGDVVEVTVADEGIGIAAADQDRVFERFYRADPARARATGGSGLGLAIVKHIAANHGGEAVLWSAEGKGSTFTLRLPAYLPEEDPENGEDAR